MSVVEINLVADPEYTGPVSFLRFTAEGSASFWDSVAEAAAHAGIELGAITGLSMVLEHGDAEMTYFVVSPEDRVSDVAALFGDDLAAEPPRVRLTAGGFGSAGDVLYELWSITEALATVGGATAAAYFMASKTRRLALARLHAEEHLAAQDWLASSSSGSGMVGLLRSRPFWEAKEVADRYGLGTEQAQNALRFSGFAYSRTSDGTPLWIRRTLD